MRRFFSAVILAIPVSALLMLASCNTDTNPTVKDKAPPPIEKKTPPDIGKSGAQ